MTDFLCPVCQNSLQEDHTRLTCRNGHSFDRAAEGYVNLLLATDKRSKVPGDNKQMVQARHSFLQSGVYAPVRKAIAEAVRVVTAGGTVLDCGCSEGYYTAAVFSELQAKNIGAEVIGIDISKFALKRAAKDNRRIRFAVASAYRLPVADRSIDTFLSVFAPVSASEVFRTVKENGHLVVAVPGAMHLYGLKQVLYDEVFIREVKIPAVDGFGIVDEKTVSYETELTDHRLIDDLLLMTPYYYKSSPEAKARIQAISALQTEIDVRILTYARK